jgi:hypothetical protein
MAGAMNHQAIWVQAGLEMSRSPPGPLFASAKAGAPAEASSYMQIVHLNPSLGAGVWRLHSAWSVAYDVTNWFTVTPTVEYSHSIAEEHNVAPQRFLEFSLPTTLLLPHDWSIGTKYKTKIDFENGDHCTHTVDLGLAKRLPSVPVVLSATLEKHLDGGNKRFEVNFTITYYFEKHQKLQE